MAKSLALGTKLYVEDPETPGTYILIGNVNAIPSVPSPTKPEVNVTDFDSTGEEFLAGLPDFGSLEFTAFWNAADAGQTICMDDAYNVDAPSRNWRIDFTRQNVRVQFAGPLTSFTPVAPGPNAAYAANGAIRVSGAPTKTTPIPAP